VKAKCDGKDIKVANNRKETKKQKRKNAAEGSGKKGGGCDFRKKKQAIKETLGVILKPSAVCTRS